MTTTPRQLETLFCPRSIAVVGASRREGTVGHAVVSNLVYGGYTGVIYPVNPSAPSVLGIRCHAELAAVGEPVDLAVSAVAPHLTEAVLEQAAELGCPSVAIITAGFGETGGAGAAAERRMAELARSKGLNVIGPNCLGVINTAADVRMNATFGRQMPRPGNLGLISQSGALCTALLDYAKGSGIGFSRFVSFGNKLDVTETDLCYALASDPNTRAILMYVEDISDAAAFIEAGQRIGHGDDPKPILVIKTGRTAEGAAASASHTGSLVGSDDVYDAMIKQAGAIRVETVAELFNLAEAFTDPVLPRGSRTAIVTNAGGPGIMATDACIRQGLRMARLSEHTRKSLQFQMPPTAAIQNPVDVIGDARHDRYRHALDAVSVDDAVDAVVVIVTPQTMTDITAIARVIGETRRFCGKPVIGCLMGLADMREGAELLHRDYGVPVFAFPEQAMRGLAGKVRYAQWLKKPLGEIARLDADTEAVSKLLAGAGGTDLVEYQALAVLEHYGLGVPAYDLAPDTDAAVAAAERIGYPVVMKIAGPKILHKTDVGGVVLNLADAAAVRKAYDDMIARVRSRMGEQVEIVGVLVQKMLAKGKEVILGMRRDARFGPLLMVGLGGIYTEALRDVSFRLAPLRQTDAHEMIHELRSIKLLTGVRGEPPSDLDALVDSLLRVSQMATEHPQIRELDINPLLVYARGEGAVAADARIILGADA